jgi:hypothetical protein
MRQVMKVFRTGRSFSAMRDAMKTARAPARAGAGKGGGAGRACAGGHLASPDAAARRCFERKPSRLPAPPRRPSLAQGAWRWRRRANSPGRGKCARGRGQCVMVSSQNSREDALPIRAPGFWRNHGRPVASRGAGGGGFPPVQPRACCREPLIQRAAIRELGDMAAPGWSSHPILRRRFYVIIEPSGAAAPAAAPERAYQR